MSLRRPLRIVAASSAGVAAAALLQVVPASAAVERFHRFEVVAQANFTVEEDCGDGTTAQTLIVVLGGREKEAVDRQPTLDNQFLTFTMQGFDCDGNFVSDRGTGEGTFSSNKAISRARVTGTITSNGGVTLDVDVSWSGTGDLERDRNVTAFPGFRGVFVGREREASATGSVVIDGAVFVDGGTADAQIETLEDRNVTRT